ncbi:hypothetical protein [Paenibacillus sp. FSL R7-277]|uniref:hypothetical protein n=1 Tax=Paenibacillus sp. FSL R7-277 TaxID=1227352 RepID=UPI00055D5475|nr:hypothetical protein [Paenibacillus sp. FSL R7-277]
MKKKLSSIFFLTTAISLVTAVPAFASNESDVNTTPLFESNSITSPSSKDSIVPLAVGESTSITVDPVNHGFSNPINGAGQYGKITLESVGKANLFVYYNTGNGVWTQMNISDPGTGFILLDAGEGSKSLNFFMNLGWQYKVNVSAYTHIAKGYLRNYQ